VDSGPIIVDPAPSEKKHMIYKICFYVIGSKWVKNFQVKDLRKFNEILWKIWSICLHFQRNVHILSKKRERSGSRSSSGSKINPFISRSWRPNNYASKRLSIHIRLRNIANRMRMRTDTSVSTFWVSICLRGQLAQPWYRVKPFEKKERKRRVAGSEIINYRSGSSNWN